MNQKPEDLIRLAGMRVTQQRLQIMEYLSVQKKPVVLTALNQHFAGKINRITLYRILNDFEQADMLRLFFSHDGHKLIEWTATTPQTSHQHEAHFHFQCKKCEKVFCLDDVEIKNLPGGFELNSQQSVLVGRCDICE